jgi:hypothetical protein
MNYFALVNIGPYQLQGLAHSEWLRAGCRAVYKNASLVVTEIDFAGQRSTLKCIHLTEGFMDRFLATASLFALCLVFPLAGCKSADQQQAANDANSASSAQGQDAAKSAPKQAAPRPKPLVVPAETVISVVLDEPVGSKVSKPGQNFTASTSEPIEVDSKVAIPKHARVTGQVVDAKPAGRFKGGASLELTLVSVEINGVEHSIHTTSPNETSKGKGKRTAAMVGGGAGGGAAIGAVAGGGKGALIGGLIGAAAGTGGAGLTGNRDITLPAETPLTFKLVDPIEIKRK